MPCSCRIPVPDYPATAAWGPILWEILHGLAEKSQQGSYPSDEVREWQKFLKATGDLLPCDECRAHFQEYLAKNPLTQFSDVPYTSLKTTVKRWLWQLHADISTEYGRVVLPFEDLVGRYGSVNFQDQFWRLEPVIKRAIDVKGMGLMSWINWNKSFKMLRSILGV